MNRRSRPCLKGLATFYFINLFIQDTPMEDFVGAGVTKRN